MDRGESLEIFPAIFFWPEWAFFCSENGLKVPKMLLVYGIMQFGVDCMQYIVLKNFYFLKFLLGMLVFHS
ncbi:hypothetical protein A3SI_09438 [Nitritalea halalkaliphila LW7]|uniref:Uncharacterized protein n=1 Tax=Nitritalea halalkaliphila LW7 TaxID=1189621 RepID=I5C4B6_9BACT|nr:hypothetical protein A3SI_09438 [Nitritalea halalkaliphila LW7]